MWKSIAEKFHCPIIQITLNAALPPARSRDAWDIHGRTNFLTRLNEAFYAYARENESFYIHDLNFVSADYGLKEWSNPLFWNMYKYAMCFEAIPSFAFSVSHIIKSIFGKNKKALALDLDNTLWGGVVGDDGVDGIEIGQETGVSQSYYEFQTYVKQLKSLGIVLTVCSKNDHENAIAGLNHPEGALRPDDFVIIKANWENKDRNIAETAAELNILPDSIVFADDNPAEREIVRTQIKGAAVPDMDGVENYITTIDRSGFFEVTTFSEDDLKRNEMYKKNALRAAEMASFGDYNDYSYSKILEKLLHSDRRKPYFQNRHYINAYYRSYYRTDSSRKRSSADYYRGYSVKFVSLSSAWRYARITCSKSQTSKSAEKSRNRIGYDFPFFSFYSRKSCSFFIAS